MNEQLVLVVLAIRAGEYILVVPTSPIFDTVFIAQVGID